MTNILNVKNNQTLAYVSQNNNENKYIFQTSENTVDQKIRSFANNCLLHSGTMEKKGALETLSEMAKCL